MNPEQADYGMFANLVKTAGFLLSAAVGLRLTWKGRARWEPSEQDVPRGAQKIGGLLCAVCLAILFSQFSTAQYSSFLAKLSLWLGGFALLSLLIYGVLISTFTCDRQASVSPGSVKTEKIIGGFWLTRRARASRDLNEVTIQELLKGAGYNADLVWPRLARALAQQMFVLGYLGLTVCGTLALTVSAMLLVIWQAQQPR
jgi:hypothetical protein